MIFEGMACPRPEFPTVAIGESGRGFDIHNDARLRELTVDLQESIVKFRWTLKERARMAPSRAELRDRATVAGVTLIFSCIRAIRLVGEWRSEAALGGGELDFLEYSPHEGNDGEVRFVFECGSELVVCARRCELRIVGSESAA